MGFSNITEAIVNTEDRINLQYDSIDPDNPDGKIIMSIAHNFRIIACGSYLIELDSEEFTSTLFHSANIYYDMITDESDSIKPYYRCLSQAEPLYDALAAGLFDIAQSIATHLPNECRIDLGENDDDYYATKLLIILLLEPENITAQEKQLSELEEYSTDCESSQVLLLKALVERDFETFEVECGAFLEEWYDEQEEMRIDETLPFYEKDTTSRICITGLAYLRIAKLLGYEDCSIDLSFAPRSLYI